jgi:hypothetical protein
VGALTLDLPYARAAGPPAHGSKPAVLPAPTAGSASDDTCPATRCGRITGQVLVAGQRTALPDATVLVLPAPGDARPGPSTPPLAETTPAWARSQRSDADGHFVFDAVPLDPVDLVRVVVMAPGFERRDEIVRIVAGTTTQQRVFVVPLDTSPFRTVVTTPPVLRSRVTEHQLTKEEIATLPGSQGDPLRALQNLPGVARPPAGLGLLVIRGSAPTQSQVFMGGHAMPRAFHILSLASVFPADVLEDLDYVPGNFDAAYGNATGGIVVVEPRRGRRDGVHGFGEVDLAAASAMVEGPLGRGSFIVGAQRAYVDGVLAGAAAVTERVTGEPSSLLLPRYYDYQALFDHPLPDGGSLGVRTFGSGDVLRARSSPDAADASAFQLRTDFHRADLVYRKQRHGWDVRLTPSFRYDINRLVAASDTFRRRRRDVIGSARAELARDVGPRASLTVGTDFELDRYSAVDEMVALVRVPAAAAVMAERDRGLQTSIGLYASSELRLGPVTLHPGTRISGFSVGERLAFAVDPRAVGEVDLSERWQLSAGLGRYSQVRNIAERNEIDLVNQGTGIQGASAFLPSAFGSLDPAVEFAPQDTQLTVREALHASVAVRHRIGEVGTAELAGFLNNQHNNVPVVSGGGTNPFDSISRAAGLEALVRLRLTRKLYGWIAYTLTYTELVLLQAPPGFPYARRPSDYDQRHNLVALVSQALPRRWRLGARFRLVSGLPYTPVVGSIALPGGHHPVFGLRNAARLPLSHQLDLRVDKQWIRDRVSVTGYVDVQNVYNRVNPEVVLYTPDFRREAGHVGLPIFPSLGVRLDW